MMHVDKNVDDHVLDVDRISREITYVPLNRRIRSKRSSCMQTFFFFLKKKWVQDILTSGLMDLKFWTCFPEVQWIEIWMCFPEVWWIWSLDVLLRGPLKLNFGRASQRSDGLKFGCASQRSDGIGFGRASQRSMKLNFGRASQTSDGIGFGHASQRSIEIEFWTCFLEVRWFWNLDVLPRGPMDLKFGRASQRSDGLKFRHASQRSDGFEIWTCFPEVRWIEIWTCFPEVQWNWILDVFPRGPIELKGIIHTDVCGPFTLVPAK